MSLPHFTFSGTSYEQGLSHGEALKDSIKKNIDVYLNRFEKEAGIENKKILENAEIYLDILREQSPEYVNGIYGIAESSNTDIIKIAMLNLRYELLYDALGKRYLEYAIDGCTSFAILPESVDNSHCIMGQNWDWIPEVNCVLTTSLDDDGLQRISFTEAGIFAGKPGMNSNGIGLSVNGMHSMDDDWSRFKKPFHLRCYEVLKSNNMDMALNALLGTTRSCTTNFIVGQAPRSVVSIELAPDKLRMIDPVDGVLIHANHFSNRYAIDVNEPPNPRRYLSEFRQNQLESLLNNSKPLNIIDIQKILQNHNNNPNSICRHRDMNLPESQHTITKTSMILDLNDLAIFVTNGQPCRSDFEKFTFN